MTRRVDLPPGLAAKSEEAKDATDGAEPEPTDKETADWLTTEAAADEFGISKRKLQRAAANGDVRTTRMGRTLLFDPRDLPSLSPDRPIVEQAAILLRQAHSHQQAMFEMFAKPLEQFLRLNAEHSKMQAERIRELEQQREEARAAIEAAESASDERAMQMLELEGREKIKGEAWEALKANAPAVLALLGARKPGSAEITLASAVGAFVDSLTPEQLGELAKQLTPPQVAAMRNIVDARRQATKTTPAGKLPAPTEGEPPSEGKAS